MIKADLLTWHNVLDEDSRMRTVFGVVLLLTSLAPAQAAETPSPIGKKVEDFQLRDYRGADARCTSSPSPSSSCSPLPGRNAPSPNCTQRASPT